MWSRWDRPPRGLMQPRTIRSGPARASGEAVRSVTRNRADAEAGGSVWPVNDVTSVHWPLAGQRVPAPDFVFIF